MCESSAFLLGKDNKLEKIIDGVIKQIRLMDHKIILEQN